MKKESIRLKGLNYSLDPGFIHPGTLKFTMDITKKEGKEQHSSVTSG